MSDPIPSKEMKEILEKNFPEFWYKIFNILENRDVFLGQMKVTKNNNHEVKKLKNEIEKIVSDVLDYNYSCKKYFSLENLEIYEDDINAFKNSVFAKELWTVKSSLNDRSNIELDRYRESFEIVTPKEVYETVRNIVKKATDYMNNVFPKINLDTIRTVDELRMDFLDDNDMLLGGVIGLGIRSELLHRLFPNAFAIMTRRSLWGMYFYSGQSEFIFDMEKDGLHRTSHQWNYDYVTFCFYNLFITRSIRKFLIDHGIIFNKEYYYGYINFMLRDYAARYKNEIDKLYTWKR